LRLAFKDGVEIYQCITWIVYLFCGFGIVVSKKRWLLRKEYYFDSRTILQFKYSYEGSWKLANSKRQRVLKDPIFFKDMAYGLFDGAFLGTPRMCGVWGIVFQSENIFITFKYVTSQETNYSIEIYFLWLLLKIALW
jgi:hypothetical protein